MEGNFPGPHGANPRYPDAPWRRDGQGIEGRARAMAHSNRKDRVHRLHERVPLLQRGASPRTALPVRIHLRDCRRRVTMRDGRRSSIPCWSSRAILLLPVSPEALEEKELALLERNVKVIETMDP